MSESHRLPDPRENKMGVMPVGKLLFTMATPMILSMLVQALYNVVDSLFVAQYYTDPLENEKVMAYILKRVPGWEAVEVPLLAPFRSRLADFPAYRLLPAHGFGAGGFCCLLRKI